MVISQEKGAKKLRGIISVHKFILINLCAAILIIFFPVKAFPQCPSNLEFYNKLLVIERDDDLSAGEKLARVFRLQKDFDQCRLNKDSVYAQMLHRIGVLQFSTGKLNEAISYTLASIKINTSGNKESNKRFAVKSYYNLGYYYATLNRFNDALRYCDLCIETANYFKDSITLISVINARNRKAHIYYQTGDYQKAIEESALGLKTAAFIKNSAITINLFIEQAQAHAAIQQIKEAVIDVNKARVLITKGDHEAFADNYKVTAIISEAADNPAEAMAYHEKAIHARSKAKDTANLASDYLDAGNTLREEAISKNTGDYSKPISYYTKSLILAQKAGNSVTAVKASNNLAAISFRTKKYSVALTGYHNSLIQTVLSFKNNNVLNNPTYRQCNSISDKNFLSLLLANKAECLLYLYYQTKNNPYLQAALNTALLTDSLVTDMRHEQAGEQSKLYWRSETREFFTTAIEACYQAKNANLGFYFMEKSRAVLLNDRLNELGLAAHLPAAEAAEEEKIQINLFAQQQKLSNLDENDPGYEKEQLKLFEAKEALSHYLKTIENKYPQYYQYKYADAVPGLSKLQKYIAASRQSFVHYFISDTAIYMLAITPSSSKFIKQNRKDFNAELFRFLKTCADISGLNNYYDNFALKAYNLYQTLFKPLALPKGRVIICSDAVMIPFEALTTDLKGNDFLINNYQFSYVYSALFLLRKFNNPPGRYNFLGVAPVSYAAYLSLPSLKNSGISLDESSAYFSSSRVLTNSKANRAGLLGNLPDYTIVAILSHARADSTYKEPLLFMADSVVKLSELQLLRNPSAKLIVLSACQTNDGKVAAGEGILTLARGFASAGIPSITGTLWKADEETIYSITKNFLENISKGMRKDDALQKAKLSFLQNGSNKNLLPYYWANMILIGNGEPVTLNSPDNKIWWLGITVSLTAISLLLFFLVIKKRKKLVIDFFQ